MTLDDLLLGSGSSREHRDALVAPGRFTLSYAQLAASARSVGAALVARGLAPGETVAASFANGPEIVAAFFGVAYTGHSGSTAVTWPNGNAESVPTQPGGTQILVNDWTYGNGSGNVGLTVSKLISASVALDAAEGDEMEERYIAVAAKQKGNLLATTEATSADYNTVRALYDGKIDTFMGFKFVHSERLQLDGNGYTRVPAWRKSAMGLGIAKDISGQIAPRPDKRFSWFVYADMSIGAARLEEAKLVEIKCL